MLKNIITGAARIEQDGLKSFIIKMDIEQVERRVWSLMNKSDYHGEVSGVEFIEGEPMYLICDSDGYIKGVTQNRFELVVSREHGGLLIQPNIWSFEETDVTDDWVVCAMLVKKFMAVECATEEPDYETLFC